MYIHVYLCIYAEAQMRRVTNVCNNVCMVITYSKKMDQPGKVANPARGQLNRENEYFPVPIRSGESGLARRVRQSRYIVY